MLRCIQVTLKRLNENKFRNFGKMLCSSSEQEESEKTVELSSVLRCIRDTEKPWLEVEGIGREKPSRPIVAACRKKERDDPKGDPGLQCYFQYLYYRKSLPSDSLGRGRGRGPLSLVFLFLPSLFLTFEVPDRGLRIGYW